uniref:Retroviral polymerase SH3-like domain-containing protein n=1 Tax=Tanacetum cinerariifolium TaxID=118510 RepID=A0A6L2N071_TANCI|nr:hypothetical protein [Tanacetum cinerariifolium]
MEQLVKLSKRSAFWSLNDDILKISILKTNTPYPSRKIRRIRACTHQRPKGNKAQYVVNMDDPNITMEEYIRLEEEKAHRHDKVYNWETTTYVFNDTLTSETTLSYEPTISSLNDNEIDFRISYDESDDEDYTVVFDKISFSYKSSSTNNFKIDSKNDNDKVNMPLFPSPEPTVNMDDPNITMEEYIRLEEEKAHRHDKVYNWETATYVFNDTLTSETTLSYEPTISSLNDNEIDFRISYDESDDEDYTVVFDKISFSYKISSTNNFKMDSKNDNDKVNMPLFPSPEPTVSCFDDLDFFKDFENEFPDIVYNDALTSKSNLTESTISSQHIDEFNLNDETSLSECDKEEQNVLKFNDLFPFNVKIDDPNITIEEYIRLVEEKVQRRALSYEPTVSSLNDEINFRVSFDESVDEDYTDELPPKSKNDMPLEDKTKQQIVMPISTREPKRNVNQSVATPLKKIVAIESTNQKPRSTTRKQYEHVSKTCRWWYSKINPPGYKWKPKTSTVNVTPNIVRDGENLDKMKEKGNACIFVGYSTQLRAFMVYNKRTRVIVGTIHVNFDELSQMASDHVSADPIPQCLTMALEQDILSPGPQSQENVPHAAKIKTMSNELDLLYSLMFDELLNGTTLVVSKSSVVHTADALDQRQQQNTTNLL